MSERILILLDGSKLGEAALAYVEKLISRLAPEEEGSWRDWFGIPKDVFVVGHVGRLAPEKNLSFLGDSGCL